MNPNQSGLFALAVVGLLLPAPAIAWTICDIKEISRPRFSECMRRLRPEESKKAQTVMKAFADAKGVAVTDLVNNLCDENSTFMINLKRRAVKLVPLKERENYGFSFDVCLNATFAQNLVED